VNNSDDDPGLPSPPLDTPVLSRVLSFLRNSLPPPSLSLSLYFSQTRAGRRGAPMNMHSLVTLCIKRFILYGTSRTLVDSRFSAEQLEQFAERAPSSGFSSRRLVRVIYDRSYPKSGYWNFNIRYNRPSPSPPCPSDPRGPSILPPPPIPSPTDISLRSSTLSKHILPPPCPSKVGRH